MPSGNPRTVEQSEMTRLVIEVLMELKAERPMTWLAERSGVDRTMLTHFRDGKKVPTVNELTAICEALDVLPSEVVREAERRRAGANVVKFPGNKGMSAQASNISSDQEEQRAAFGSDIDAEFDAHENQP